VKTTRSLAAKTDSILAVEAKEKNRHRTNNELAALPLPLGVDWNSLVLELA